VQAGKFAIFAFVVSMISEVARETRAVLEPHDCHERF
jgi:hypothetical protein